MPSTPPSRPVRSRDDERLVQRQAFAGLMWTKQAYHFDVGIWLDGDPAGPPPPRERRDRPRRRVASAEHRRRAVHARRLGVPLVRGVGPRPSTPSRFALIDAEFAKQQLLLLTREWYMHPNGQLPAYEWAFSDVNPPVHAWAAWRVYKIDARITGRPDRPFLERIFHKLLLNFTWWVNRKDADGHNVFQGGFLGLDNIGVFDRSAPLPQGRPPGPGGRHRMDGLLLPADDGHRARARDARTSSTRTSPPSSSSTSCTSPVPSTASVAPAIPLWDEEDGFFYDVLHLPDETTIQLKVRSLVGLIPLLAVETIEPEVLERLPGFARRLRWFLRNRPDLAALVASWEEPGVGQRTLLALVRGHRMKRLLQRMLDPDEFLSAHGVRSLSRAHLARPYRLDIDGQMHEVRYEPAESRTGLFGGNSNWRGPVWFPIDYLLIEALETVRPLLRSRLHGRASHRVRNGSARSARSPTTSPTA